MKKAINKIISVCLALCLFTAVSASMDVPDGWTEVFNDDFNSAATSNTAMVAASTLGEANKNQTVGMYKAGSGNANYYINVGKEGTVCARMSSGNNPVYAYSCPVSNAEVFPNKIIDVQFSYKIVTASSEANVRSVYWGAGDGTQRREFLRINPSSVFLLNKEYSFKDEDGTDLNCFMDWADFRIIFDEPNHKISRFYVNGQLIATDIEYPDENYFRFGTPDNSLQFYLAGGGSTCEVYIDDLYIATTQNESLIPALPADWEDNEPDQPDSERNLALDMIPYHNVSSANIYNNAGSDKINDGNTATHYRTNAGDGTGEARFVSLDAGEGKTVEFNKIVVWEGGTLDRIAGYAIQYTNGDPTITSGWVDLVTGTGIGFGKSAEHVFDTVTARGIRLYFTGLVQGTQQPYLAEIEIYKVPNTDTNLLSSKYVIENQLKEIAAVADSDLDVAVFSSNIRTNNSKASFEIFQSDGTTPVTSGSISPSCKVIVYAEDGVTQAEYSIILSSQIISALNSDKTETALRQTLSRYQYVFGIDYSIYDTLANQSNVYNLFSTGLKDVVTVADVAKVFAECTATQKINESAAVDLSEYYEMLGYSNATEYTIYSLYENNSYVQEKVNDTLLNKNFLSVEQVKNAINTCVFTSFTYEAGNWAEFDLMLSQNSEFDLFYNHGKYLQLTDKSTVGAAVVGKDLTLSALTDAINSAIENAINPPIVQPPKQSSSSGSTSSGGGSGGGTVSFSGMVPSSTPLPVISSPAPSPSPQASPKPKLQFDDMSDVDWAQDAVAVMADKGIVTGKSEKEFAPHDAITREEFIKLLVSAFDLLDQSAVCTFDDTPETAWYYKYVASAYKEGLTTGIDQSNFGAGRNITRQEMTALLYRTLKTKASMPAEINQDISFNDIDLADLYAQESIMYMARCGIVNGTGNGMFAPLDLTTRAQAATVIYNIKKHLGEW